MKIEFKKLLSVETKERRYTPIIMRFLIELIIFGVPGCITFILIPFNTLWRLIPVFFIVCILFSFFFFVFRCFGVSDNRSRDRFYREKYKEKFKPISISKEDLIYWLENAKLDETLVIKSILNKYSVLELFVHDGKKEIFLDNKKMSTIDSLISVLEDKGYFEDSLVVCETFDHNKPEYLNKIISDLKTNNNAHIEK